VVFWVLSEQALHQLDILDRRRVLDRAPPRLDARRRPRREATVVMRERGHERLVVLVMVLVVTTLAMGPRAAAVSEESAR